MKKIIAIALSVMLLALCFAGCQTSAGSDKETVVVGYTIYAPMNYLDENGELIGFDTDLAKAVFEGLGYEVIFQEIDWSSKYTDLNSGAIDCVWNGFTCTGREDQYTWSDPYVDNSIVLVVKKDSGIASMADLAGKTVMAQAASSAADAINGNEAFKSSLKEVIELADYNMGFMELKQGTVDAIAADLGVAAYQIANNEGEYVILDEAVSTEQYAVGFLKGNTELRDAVNAELKKMAEDGTMLKIAEKYVDSGLVIESLCMLP